LIADRLLKEKDLTLWAQRDGQRLRVFFTAKTLRDTAP
jgi:hypothetical protein